MSQVIIKIFIAFEIMMFAAITTAATPAVRKPLKDLFSHPGHSNVFKSATVNCTDCHNFTLKSPSFDPLAPNVGDGHLKVSYKTCHECHMGKTTGRKINQCSLCHESNAKLAPENHKLAWRTRHGHFAQMDPDSCTTCHQENQNSCSNCHTQRNVLRPHVHRPNFRLTHSIEARSNPASCVTCHTAADTCTKCHQNGAFR